jgi:hypothetical protein
MLAFDKKKVELENYPWSNVTRVQNTDKQNITHLRIAFT